MSHTISRLGDGAARFAAGDLSHRIAKPASQELASLTDVHWTMSGEVVLMTLLGGIGTIFGPIAGAAVIITMENYLAKLGSWFTIVQGVVFVVCVLAFRRGIIGEIANLIKKPL